MNKSSMRMAGHVLSIILLAIFVYFHFSDDNLRFLIGIGLIIFILDLYALIKKHYSSQTNAHKKKHLLMDALIYAICLSSLFFFTNPTMILSMRIGMFILGTVFIAALSYLSRHYLSHLIER